MEKRVSIATTLLSLAILALGSTTALAADAVYAGPIRMLYPNADGTYVLILNANMAACGGITGYKYLYIKAGQNGVTADGQKNIIATSMLAFAADRNTSIVYDDSTTNCWINRISVGD